MMRLQEIKIRENLSDEEVFEKALKKNHIHREDVSSWRIIKKSVDARNKRDVHFVYVFEVELSNGVQCDPNGEECSPLRCLMAHEVRHYSNEAGDYRCRSIWLICCLYNGATRFKTNCHRARKNS